MPIWVSRRRPAKTKKIRTAKEIITALRAILRCARGSIVPAIARKTGQGREGVDDQEQGHEFA